MKLVMENWKKYLKDLVVNNPLSSWLEENQPEFVRIQNFAISRTNHLFLWTPKGPQRKKLINKANSAKGTPDERRARDRLRDWDDNAYRGNAFRHMLTSLMISHISMGPELTTMAGYAKEAADLIYKNVDTRMSSISILQDSEVDSGNNEVGVELSKRFSHISPDKMKNEQYVKAVLYRIEEGEFWLDPKGDPQGKDGIITSAPIIKYKDLIKLRERHRARLEREK